MIIFPAGKLIFFLPPAPAITLKVWFYKTPKIALKGWIIMVFERES